jgi:hypothetical protein
MLMIIDAHAHIYDVLTGYGARGEFRPLCQGKGIWSTGEPGSLMCESAKHIVFKKYYTQSFPSGG